MESTRRRFAGSVASAHFVSRRILMAVTPRLANRRFAFTIAAVAVLGAKVLHVFAHLNALPTTDLLRWGVSFFTQDSALLLLLRLLIEGHPGLFVAARWLGVVATTAASAIVSVVLLLATISISFFMVAGSELQWRNIAVAGDASSWKMMLTGLLSCALVLAALLVSAGVLQTLCYVVAGIALDILKWPVTSLFSKLSTWRRRVPSDAKYEHLPPQDLKEPTEHIEECWDCGDQEPPLASSKPTVLLYVLVGILLMAQVVCTLLRPADSSLIYMSWTLPLMPWVDFAHSTPTLASSLAFSSSINGSLDNHTALAKPIALPWLPKHTPLAGFEDWYDAEKDHYSAAADPLKLSNLDDNLLPALRDIKLADISIRHVMLVKLESTRKDIFPIKRDGIVWERLASTFKTKSLPEEAQKMLASLTPTAKFLTGDHDDGFEGSGLVDSVVQSGQKKRRGGINANNAYTTSTYTLKSLVGTLCGLSPLAADFNVDQAHHIYQPCLAHIFEAFNKLGDDDQKPTEDDFTSLTWKSSFMQSVTDRFDKQDRLMPVLGYAKEHERMIDWWYLKGSPKFGVVNLTDVNYYGMPEVALEDYIRDAFVVANQTNQRVFLSHLTSTTHHAFGIPEEETYVPLTDDKEWDDLSHYLNAVGYVDRWLGKILDILDSEGVANDTLLILVGDHGLSIAERGTITPYSNPHVANYHVPLVISHPKLPQIDINDAVTSLQILPTVLDLLIETGSLSKSESQAARDLVRNYEGQSLLRPLRKFSEGTGQGDWQFTVMNPGGSTLAVRDARQPNWRLIVPVFGNYEWRFTDLATDPHEKNATLSFDFDKLLGILESNYGAEAARWVEEAVVVTRWWANENYKRWRYDPS
ncbi:Lipoteichoic acid synthase-like YvgJ [Tolypocladium paradoxum]|uniref:Lipoteichoic acid synthase-like YvgJ n=1 Tax=Tolypocladium paradoxum TaxID=94208 RepID=A0A2S4L318_9HYPO|nr:Lipoteichoic acid synthase-like YvgJ [Tolypocladium paradoxum]